MTTHVSDTEEEERTEVAATATELQEPVEAEVPATETAGEGEAGPLPADDEPIKPTNWSNP